jgi:hypothetical protein
MPANPLHFSAIVSLHFKWSRTFDVSALLYSSTLVDLEILYHLLVGGPTGHGVWHSYLFILTIYPLVLSFATYGIERKLEEVVRKIHKFFRFSARQVKYPFKKIYLSCLFGGASHIFFDMWTHERSDYILFPFYQKNPFWIGEWSIIIDALTILLSLYTFFLWVKQIQN